jgi:D-alanine--poly(phosphoribitol) ligase subunit 2
MESEKIVHIIFAVIDETNAELSADWQIEKSKDAILFGNGGKLDSLGIVNFIVAVEDRVLEELGILITLADEQAMSQRNSPFRTVSSLSTYIAELMGRES